MKKLLVVVDYQKDFVTGALGCPAADRIADAICTRIRQARAEGDDVAFTLDTHGANYSETQEGKKLPVLHCVKETEGWRLDQRVEALREDKDILFEKGSFGSQALFDFLRNSSYQSVTFVGVVTNICVVSNAVLAKAALPEAEIAVDAAATASNDPILHEKTLDVLESMQVTVHGR